MWNRKYDTNELTYETDSQMEKRLVVAKGKEGRETVGVKVWGKQI